MPGSLPDERLRTMAEVELGKRLELLEIAGSRAARRIRRDLGTFLDSSERRAKLSREERLRIVEQALVLVEMTYVHLPMKRAIHAIDPIQQLKLLRFQLAESSVGLESTTGFHRRMLFHASRIGVPICRNHTGPHA